MTTIEQILFTEAVPTSHLTTYPFSVTLHFPESHPLSQRELVIFDEAIVNAAQQIKMLRGDADQFNFARIQNGVIDWEGEMK